MYICIVGVVQYEHVYIHVYANDTRANLVDDKQFEGCTAVVQISTQLELINTRNDSATENLHTYASSSLHMCVYTYTS